MQKAVIAYPGISPRPGVGYCQDRGASTFVRNSENCAGNSCPLGILLDKGPPFAFLRTAHASLISALHMWRVASLFTSCVHHGVNGLTPLDPVGKPILSLKFCSLFCIVRLKTFDLTCCVCACFKKNLFQNAGSHLICFRILFVPLT